MVEQSYANHARWYWPHHFVAAPILLGNVVWRAWQAAERPTGESVWAAIVAVGLVGLLAASRLQTLKVQNRVVRLEMRLRLAQLLPPDLAARVPELRLGQLLGLRFASDAELPGLVRRALDGELANADAIKREVKHWQPDHLRA
jgi:Family of unknown function (DUF6526)